MTTQELPKTLGEILTEIETIKSCDAKLIAALIAPYHRRGKDADYDAVVGRELGRLEFDTVEALETALSEVAELLWERL